MIHHSATLLIFFLVASLLVSSCQKRKQAQQSQSQDSLSVVQHLAAQQMSEDSNPSAIDQDVVFSFSDSSGHYLIGGDSNSLSHGPYLLIRSSGDTVRLEQIGYRKESEHSTHRQIASNFQETGGNLFYVESESLTPGQTYLIVSGRYLANHQPLHLALKHYTPLDSTAIERISRARARAIRQSWHLASLDTIGEIAIVMFEQNDTNPLASLVVVKKSSLIFEDYVGDASSEGSVWRVDDGGEFGAKAISIIAAFQSTDGIELARIWAAFEGENTEFLRQSFNRFVPVLDYYRYWVPE